MSFTPQPLEPEERNRIEQVLDRIEDRLRDAEPGFHQAGSPADPDALAASQLPGGAKLVWERWDGMVLGPDEARLHPLAEIRAATDQAEQEGILRAGDIVIGERGRDIFVLPADPWAEGAEVVVVEEAGDRSPDASTVAHLVLGLLGEVAILYDHEGEFRDELFGDDGALFEAAERRLLRRRLDADPDAPLTRLRLAQLLRRAGELRGARSELNRVLRCAPEFAWAQHELGRVLFDLGNPKGAALAHAKAAEYAPFPELRTYYLAWAARRAPPEDRASFAAKVEQERPGFAGDQLMAAREQWEYGERATALELLELGLAVAPRNLELLELRRTIEKTPVEVLEDEPYEELPDDLDDAESEPDGEPVGDETD